jgi:hypothetical protein
MADVEGSLVETPPPTRKEDNLEKPPGGDGDAGDGKNADNAVSALQEIIQSCCSFSPHTKILTWAFEQQLSQGTLEFRATVSFVLQDVPHHFGGGWQTSKKKAQRDAAERVTHYLQHLREPIPVTEPQTHPSKVVMGSEKLPQDVFEELQAVFTGSSFEGEPALEWKLEDRGLNSNVEGVHEFRAIVSFHINEVPHHFSGGWCSGGSENGYATSRSDSVAGVQAARRDAAERVLWYFGEGQEFYGVPEGTNLSLEAPVQLQSDSAASPEKQPQLEDKTILMQVQNHLQKVFAKVTPPGERVWVWNYEGDDNDPQIFRARVDIPCWGRSFVGGWCRGKKLAQRNACLVVKENLDALNE